jgi:DNA-directed RNA polymerase specialized sigma24 family protein
VKWLDVKRLFLAGYGKLLHMKGLDVEDVLQEVYMGLLIRNSGDGAWDPAKSSFGHYVHMVCGSVVLNYVSKQKRVHRTDMSLRREIMQIARSGLSLCY